MNLSQLKSQLQSSIPEELYKIEPGQIVVLIPNEGITEQTASNISDIFHTFTHFGFGEQIKLQVLPTDKPELIGAVIGRRESDIESPYNLIISDKQSLMGFLAEYFNFDFDEFTDRSKISAQILRLKLKNRPLIISINPEDCPVRPQHTEPAQFTCPYMNGSDFDGVHALVAEKNRPSISAMQNKIADLLSQCEQYGYDIDVVGLKNAARESMKMAKSFKLKLDFKLPEQKLGHYTSSTLKVCDIYIVGDDAEYKIDFTPVQKALYLTTILNREFYLTDPSFSFIEDLATIFKQIPEHQEKVKEIKDGKIKRTVNVGVIAKSPSISNILGIRKDIKDTIAATIGYGPAVNEFAIEGYRKEAYSIRKATDKHREQIKKYFGL